MLADEKFSQRKCKMVECFFTASMILSPELEMEEERIRITFNPYGCDDGRGLVVRMSREEAGVLAKQLLMFSRAEIEVEATA